MFPSLKKATLEKATVADCEVKVCVKLLRFWVVFKHLNKSLLANVYSFHKERTGEMDVWLKVLHEDLSSGVNSDVNTHIKT